MTIRVRVVPRAKKAKIEVFNSGLKIYLNAPAVAGKANKSLIELVADYYKVRKYNVTIIKGRKQRDKVIKISEVS